MPQPKPINSNHYSQCIHAALQREFGEHGVDVFFAQYWQKKPLYLKAVFDPNWQLLSEQQLLALSADDNIESRLVTRCNNRYQLHHGPFLTPPSSAESILLLQAVDHHDHSCFDFLRGFDLIPRWMLDDLMISMASLGGSVGPHFDRYDVFLVQGLGQRTWQVGDKLSSSTELSERDGLCLLEDATFSQQYQCRPGDILYIPPLHAHFGIATSDNSHTYSVGCRIPSTADLLQHLLDQAPQQWQQPLSSPRLNKFNQPQKNGLQVQLAQQLDNSDLFNQQLGELTSQPKYSPPLTWTDIQPQDLFETHQQWQQQQQPLPLYLYKDVRLDLQGSRLFLNGISLSCAQSALSCAQYLYQHHRLPPDSRLEAAQYSDQWHNQHCTNSSQLICLLLFCELLALTK